MEDDGQQVRKLDWVRCNWVHEEPSLDSGMIFELACKDLRDVISMVKYKYKKLDTKEIFILSPLINSGWEQLI